MPTWLKILLIVLGAGLLVIVGVVVAATMWFQSNKEEIQRQADRVRAEARAFGEMHQDHECLDHSLKRADECGEVSIMCQAEAAVFLQVCLDASARTEGFCDGVPSPDAIMDSAMYRVSKCEALGGRQGDGPCGRLLGSVEKHCRARATTSAP